MLSARNLRILAVSAFTVLSCSALSPADDDQRRSVSVNGTAVTRIAPDTIVWALSVTTYDEDLSVASKSNDESLQNLNDIRKNVLKVDDKDFQTSYLSIRKVFNRDKRGNQLDFRHFAVSRSITMKQQKLEKFDEVFKRLSSMKDIEASYSLESSKYLELRRKTRIDAVKIARIKAKEMTETLGAKLGPVLSLSEEIRAPGVTLFNGVSNAANFQSEQGGADNIGGTFAPGAIEIRISVRARFEIR